MTRQEISSELIPLLEGEDIFYLSLENDLTDFRNNKSPKIKIYSRSQSVEITISNDERLGTVIGFLSVALFDGNHTIVSWNIKELFSWFQFHYPFQPMTVKAKVFDLRVCEAFNGELKTNRPESFKEALTRLSVQLQNPKLAKVNNKVFSPLSLEVLPTIETSGLISSESSTTRRYSSYMIDGALNGRMSCRLAFDGAFNPHNMTDEIKSEFLPGEGKSFLILDYAHMEISVWQWMSGDETLKGIIDSGEDAYAATYKLISGASKCNQSNRDWMKKILLPVAYGCGANSLSESLGLSPKAAQSIIDKLKQSYPQAFAFMDAIQEEAKSGFITDKLGRKYPFSDREPYKARNAIIQGVGALVCLEKLVELYEARMSDLKLVASIHDAYVGIADEKLIDKIGVCCREVLETESKLAPGLFLKAVAKVGPKWHEVQNLI